MTRRITAGQESNTTIVTPSLFSITPVQANANAYIDYTSGTGKGKLNSETKKLHETFDG